MIVCRSDTVITFHNTAVNIPTTVAKKAIHHLPASPITRAVAPLPMIVASHEEWQSEAGGKQQAADGRSDEGVGHHLRAPQAPVGPFQLIGGDHRGQDRLSSVVAQHLGKAEQHRSEGQSQVDHPVGTDIDPGGEHFRARQPCLVAKHGGGDNDGQPGAGYVHCDHDLASVDSVGDDPGRQGEHQPRQPLCHGDQGDEHRVSSHGRCQPGVGDEGDSVAEVGDHARRPQSAVSVAERRLRRQGDGSCRVGSDGRSVG